MEMGVKNSEKGAGPKIVVFVNKKWQKKHNEGKNK